MSDQPQNHTPNWRHIVGLAAALLLAAAVLAAALPQPAPLTVTYAGPQDSASASTFIRIAFSAAMNRTSATERLSIEPALAGSAAWWNDRTLVYYPADRLAEGDRYTVTLAAGAEGEDGASLADPVSFSFMVTGPRIIYAAPADSRPENLWLLDLADPDAPRQITFSEAGVYDYAVSPDGGRIAYAERSPETGGIEIMLLDLATGAAKQITACGESACSGPVWHPDGTMLAFERRNNTPDASPTVWLADLRPITPDVYALPGATETTVYAPAWSPDGTLLAVYNEDSIGLSIIEMQAGAEIAFAPTQNAGQAHFSPDSRQIAYADIVLGPTSARTQYSVFDIATQRITPLSTENAPLDDGHALWTAEGDLLLSRQYLDDRYTPGRQIYRAAPETGDVKPLLVDAKYAHGYFELSPAGNLLVIQRVPEGGGPATGTINQPEIWLYNLSDGTLVKLATNAFLPHWVP